VLREIPFDYCLHYMPFARISIDLVASVGTSRVTWHLAHLRLFAFRQDLLGRHIACMHL
jgi:hypothetical protein